MALLADLLVEPLRYSRGGARAALLRIEATALTGQVTEISEPLSECARRISQAARKISAENEIRTTSELITLAQFGAGSIGAAVAQIYEAPKFLLILQNLYVSKFLTSIVLHRVSVAPLLPADLLRKYGLERHQLNEPAIHPALAELVERACAACPFSELSVHGIQNYRLALIIAFETALQAKSLQQLAKDPTIYSPIELGALKRLTVAGSVLFRRRT